MTTTPSGRSSAQVRWQYQIEKALARRLREAAPDRRAATYCEVYAELFRSVPDHPQFIAAADHERRQREVLRFVSFLAPWLTPVGAVVEIGAGDCHLAAALCTRVARVVAVDVAREVSQLTALPPNLELVISDGTRIDLPDGCMDLAFSNQLLEHIHPDDVRLHLREVARVLKPGACYVCLTPNRLSGPHDISRAFDDVATGFHLREYTIRELRDIMLTSGYRRVDFALVRRGRFAGYPLPAAAAVEAMAQHLPTGLRRRLRRNPVFCKLLSIQAVAVK